MCKIQWLDDSIKCSWNFARGRILGWQIGIIALGDLELYSWVCAYEAGYAYEAVSIPYSISESLQSVTLTSMTQKASQNLKVSNSPTIYCTAASWSGHNYTCGQRGNHCGGFREPWLRCRRRALRCHIRQMTAARIHTYVPYNVDHCIGQWGTRDGVMTVTNVPCASKKEPTAKLFSLYFKIQTDLKTQYQD